MNFTKKVGTRYGHRAHREGKIVNINIVFYENFQIQIVDKEFILNLLVATVLNKIARNSKKAPKDKNSLCKRFE